VPIGVALKSKPRRITSSSGSSSGSTPVLAPVVQPIIIPSAAADEELEYLDERRVPGSTIVLPPVAAPAPPPLPTPLPDMQDIPEIQLPTPIVAEPPESELPPSLADIPEIGDSVAPSSERPSRREPRSELSTTTRPMSGPPPYEDTPGISMYEQAQLDAKSGIADRGSVVGSSLRRSVLEGRAPIDPSVRDSIATARTSVIFEEAEALRATAAEKEAEVKRLEAEADDARRERRFHDALMHKVQREEAEEEARKALEKAEQKVFRGPLLFSLSTALCADITLWQQTIGNWDRPKLMSVVCAVQRPSSVRRRRSRMLTSVARLSCQSLWVRRARCRRAYSNKPCRRVCEGGPFYP
jgi:hypothetical protein